MKTNALLLLLLTSFLLSCQKDNWPEQEYNNLKASFTGDLHFINETFSEGYTLPGGMVQKESYEPVTVQLIGLDKRIFRETISTPDANSPYFASFEFENVPAGTYFIRAESENYKCWGTEAFEFDPEVGYLTQVDVFQKDFRNVIDGVNVTYISGPRIDCEVNFSHKQNRGEVYLVFYASEKAEVSHENFREKFIYPYPAFASSTLNYSLYLENFRNYYGDSIYFNMYMTVLNPTFEPTNEQGKTYVAPYSRRTFKFAVKHPNQ